MICTAAIAEGGTIAAGRGKLQAQVNREDALAYVGYSGQVIDDALAARFENLARTCEETFQIGYTWRIERIDAGRRFGELVPQVVLAGSGLTLEGADISRHLSGAELVAIFAATLGQASEMELNRLAATSPLDHLLFDCCASSLMEAGAHKVQELLGEEARKLGLVAHARFSPGYGDLSLEIQPDFLKVLDAGRVLGVCATEQNLLLPVKSITAVLGFFPGEDDDAPSPCELCAAKEYCCYRERGTTCHGR